MAASVAGSRVTLSWRPSTTGAAPTSYIIDVSTTSGASNIAQGYNVGNVLSVAGDLGKGTYYARVRAANAAGVSASSNEVRFSVGKKLRTPGSLAVNWTGRRRRSRGRRPPLTESTRSRPATSSRPARPPVRAMSAP